MKYEVLEEWFTNYVKSFKGTEKEEAMLLKEEHTHRVKANAENIAKKRKMSEHDITLAKTIGLLHDIGRFPQMRDYGTFRDDLSIDHGVLGVQIVEEEHLLTDWSEEDQKIIRLAISLHNKAEENLPKNLPEKRAEHLSLIRDADKIDIMLFAYEKEQTNKAVWLQTNNLVDEKTIKKSIEEKVFQQENIIHKEVETLAEKKIFFLNWIHEMNFNESVVVLKEQDCFERLLETIPQEYTRLKNYLEKVYQEKITLAS